MLYNFFSLNNKLYQPIVLYLFPVVFQSVEK